jgi:ComF family protein
VPDGDDMVDGMEQGLDQNPARFQLRAQAFSMVKSLWRATVDIVTPARCLHCLEPVVAGASLCAVCWSQLALLSEPVCDALGTPFEADLGDGLLSAAALADPPPWDQGRAAVQFNDASAHIVHLLKYRDTQEAGILMARMMWGAGARHVAAADLIVPVPLHRFRLWQRRFNQAAYLARAIAGLSERPVDCGLLTRVKRTRQQVGLTADARHKNVRRAFEIDPEKRHLVDGKRVVLVDDVRTTGATLASASQVLRDSGAIHICVLTFALVVGPHRPDIDV